MTTKKLLVVGSSEASLFRRYREYLEEEYGVKVWVDSAAGRRLEECVVPVIAQMREDTSILLIWSLTTWAWKKQAVYNGESSTTVFGPCLSYSTRDVAPIMEEIVGAARSKNPSCRVYLSIPAIKDMYAFNQTRLCRAWGERARNFFRGNGLLGPAVLRNHSIRAYHDFESIMDDRSENWWTDKRCLRGTFALSYLGKLHNKRSGQNRKIPPHLSYVNGQSLHLNVPALPDGLHGNRDFLVAFCKKHKTIFQEPNRNLLIPSITINFTESSEENHEESEILHGEPEKKKIKRTPIVLNFNEEIKERACDSREVATTSRESHIPKTDTNQVTQIKKTNIYPLTKQARQKWTPIVFDLDSSVKSTSRVPIEIVDHSPTQLKKNWEPTTASSFKIAWTRAVKVSDQEMDEQPPLDTSSENFGAAWQRAVRVRGEDRMDERNNEPTLSPERVPPFGTNSLSLHELIPINQDVSPPSLEQPSTSTDVRFLPPLTIQMLQEPGGLTVSSNKQNERVKIRALARQFITRIVPTHEDKERKKMLLQTLQDIINEECQVSQYEDTQ